MPRIPFVDKTIDKFLAEPIDMDPIELPDDDLDPPQGVERLANAVTCNYCHRTVRTVGLGVDVDGLYLTCPVCAGRNRPKDGIVWVVLP